VRARTHTHTNMLYAHISTCVLLTGHWKDILFSKE